MNRYELIWIIFIGVGINPVLSQISPGALSSPHKQLEGISNCTQCHDLGNKVPIEKCLSCHKDVKERIDNNRGYHVSKDVKAVSCIQCHSEHHGLKFEIVHFDKAKFDHKLTGYSLTGKHEEIDCNKCHDSKWITDDKAKKKNFTYLGLDTKCKVCHEDVHRGTLPADCATCHTTNKFVPAGKFDHQKSHYPLVGKHREVKCVECHKIDKDEGKSFQYFTHLRYDQCSACHKNVHDKSFGPNCSACHNEQSFHALNANTNFNHTLTGYTLKGKHRSIDCKACHKLALNTLSTAYQDFVRQKIEGCISCHKDIHENKFGQNCAQCHTEQSFKMQKVPDGFDHGLTAFKLEGKHTSVDCKKCHTGKMTDPLPHSRCTDCHKDYHQGEFTHNKVMEDCGACHVVQSFGEVIYTIEEHAKTTFPLAGAHLATPCIDCHKKSDQWVFKALKTACVDCHKDIHEGQLAAKYYPDKNCVNCHQQDSWHTIKFNHDSTNFVLSGKHKAQSCISCHSKLNTSVEKGIIFKQQNVNCESCHKDIHQGQFVQNGVSDCAHCHGFMDWTAPKFDHQSAAFILDGSHKKVACDQCHKPIEIKGVYCIQYKLTSFKCIDCHF